jgi:hypothetical protein
MRKHDDAHRPLGGRGQRGNRARTPANWGGAELVEHDVYAETIARQQAALDAGHDPLCLKVVRHPDKACTCGVRGTSEGSAG